VEPRSTRSCMCGFAAISNPFLRLSSLSVLGFSGTVLKGYVSIITNSFHSVIEIFHTPSVTFLTLSSDYNKDVIQSALILKVESIQLLSLLVWKMCVDAHFSASKFARANFPPGLSAPAAGSPALHIKLLPMTAGVALNERREIRQVLDTHERRSRTRALRRRPAYRCLGRRRLRA
jgi:hypothetical protein